MRVITLRPRLGISGKYLKATWHSLEEKCDYSVPEIIDEIKHGSKIELDMTYTGKHKSKFNPDELIYNLIEKITKHAGKTDTNLTRRVLNAGGLLSYARKLEADLGITQ